MEKYKMTHCSVRCFRKTSSEGSQNIMTPFWLCTISRWFLHLALMLLAGFCFWWGNAWEMLKYCDPKIARMMFLVYIISKYYETCTKYHWNKYAYLFIYLFETKISPFINKDSSSNLVVLLSSRYRLFLLEIYPNTSDFGAWNASEVSVAFHWGTWNLTSHVLLSKKRRSCFVADVHIMDVKNN